MARSTFTRKLNQTAVIALSSMKISEVKLGEVVHITQKNIKYSWNSVDIFGRVETINENDVHLLLPSGDVERYDFDKGEEFEPVEVHEATEYLFVEKIEEELKSAQSEAEEANNQVMKIASFRDKFINEMSFVSRLKTFLRQ